MKKKLHTADTDMVRRGDVADVYFVRAEEILKKRDIRRRVVMEVFLKSFPEKTCRWGVFAGLEEVCTLLEGRGVTLWSMPEGSVFFPRTPVMVIEGDYLQFGGMETAILGCLCQASDIVEIEGAAIAKRGKESGRKAVLRCRQCMKDFVVPAGSGAACGCPGEPEPLLMKIMETGRVFAKLPAPRQIRERCLAELSALRGSVPAKEFLTL
jgi:nicotinic acid phosphoribosyltransferase